MIIRMLGGVVALVLAAGVHAATDYPSGYTKCAQNTGATCSMSGTRSVALGKSGSFVYATKTGNFACIGSAFPSNSYTESAWCSYGPTSSGSSSSSSTSTSSSSSSTASSASSSSTAAGTINMTIPSATGTVINSGTTTIPAGTTKSYGNQRIGVKNSVGNCEDEGQIPVFLLEEGATLKDVIIYGGVNGSDGVHCKGSCTIQNVYWEDVCEDAASNLGAGSTVTIKNIIAISAADKTFQHNSKNSTTIVQDSYVKNVGKLWRSCGNCTSNGGPRKVTINNVKLDGVSASVVGVNNNYGDVATIRKLQIKGYKSGSPEVCVEYIGYDKSAGKESTKVGEKWNTTACNVSKTDVTSY
ncbi:pectate lyase [Uliginosibacterium paludis]|uniref:Pectate lyase n=1 Tax=Uliginosibacterium paludis TaxID=1615952 RepID=A0ABV2CLD3_9RHOO